MTASPRAVTFVSDGARLAGTLYLPPDQGGPVPAIVIAPGWASRRLSGVEGRALQLLPFGIAALTFDFRGYGESEGTPERLYPQEFVTDIRAAGAFLRTQAEIDPERIAVMGTLTSAAAALQAASEDDGLAAVVALFPFGDGRRWMRLHRSYWEWRELQRRVEDDARARSTGADPVVVDSNEIRILPPHDALRETGLRERTRRLTLASAGAIMAFRPEDHVHRIAPRAVMLVVVVGDVMIPLDEVERIYAKLGEPKRLLIVKGEEHREVGGRFDDQPYPINDSMDRIAEFLLESMPPRLTTLGDATYVERPAT